MGMLGNAAWRRVIGDAEKETGRLLDTTNDVQREIFELQAALKALYHRLDVDDVGIGSSNDMREGWEFEETMFDALYQIDNRLRQAIDDIREITGAIS